MHARKTIISLAAAAALTLAVAGATLAAPTVSGELSCTYADGYGDGWVDMGTFDGTRKDLAATKKSLLEPDNICAKGSVKFDLY